MGFRHHQELASIGGQLINGLLALPSATISKRGSPPGSDPVVGNNLDPLTGPWYPKLDLIQHCQHTWRPGS